MSNLESWEAAHADARAYEREFAAEVERLAAAEAQALSDDLDLPAGVTVKWDSEDIIKRK
jgi:hypothetical protein